MKPVYQGKVRDIYEVDTSTYLIVASDRMSAFDVIFPNPFPLKGKILNQISIRWFEILRKSGLYEKFNFTDHLISGSLANFPPYFQKPEFENRSMLVRRVKRIDFEFVVRGYLAGSAFKEYINCGSVTGIELPTGLLLSSKLPSPIFTPATKADKGHDENVPFSTMTQSIGEELSTRLRDISIAIFAFASSVLDSAGIILCDTKFEFGLDDRNQIVLIDEALTPDCSRYWDKNLYIPGENQDSFDKQILRDYIETTEWDKTPPAPNLPAWVIEKTMSRYQEIFEKITARLMELNPSL